MKLRYSETPQLLQLFFCAAHTFQRYLKNDDEARSRIVRAAELGTINSSDIVPVFKEFKNPRHPEFAEPTRYSLLNAFTETIKKYTPLRVDQSYMALNRCFGLDGKRPVIW